MTAWTSNVKLLAEFIYFRYYWKKFTFNIILPRWTDKCFIKFIDFADIQLSFTSNQNVLHVTFHFIKSFNKNIAPKYINGLRQPFEVGLAFSTIIILNLKYNIII